MTLRSSVRVDVFLTPLCALAQAPREEGEPRDDLENRPELVATQLPERVEERPAEPLALTIRANREPMNAPTSASPFARKERREADFFPRLEKTRREALRRRVETPAQIVKRFKIVPEFAWSADDSQLDRSAPKTPSANAPVAHVENPVGLELLREFVAPRDRDKPRRAEDP